MRWHTNGIKHFHHRVAGDLVLAYEGLDLVTDDGLTMITFTVQPTSALRQALAFLASSSTSLAMPERQGHIATSKPAADSW